MLKMTEAKPYPIPVVMRTFDVLELLYRSGTSLKMEEIRSQSGVPRSTTYRILRTLNERGYIEQLKDGSYRSIRELSEDTTRAGPANDAVGIKANPATDSLIEQTIEGLMAILVASRRTPAVPLPFPITSRPATTDRREICA